eukprot:5669467-Prymnesium_polylepis.2
MRDAGALDPRREVQKRVTVESCRGKAHGRLREGAATHVPWADLWKARAQVAHECTSHVRCGPTSEWALCQRGWALRTSRRAVARVERGLDPEAQATRLGVSSDFARATHLHPSLDGARAELDALLLQPKRIERAATRDHQLGAHDVHARCLLTHRVLDLNPRVALEEDGPCLATPRVEQELASAC